MDHMEQALEDNPAIGAPNDCEPVNLFMHSNQFTKIRELAPSLYWCHTLRRFLLASLHTLLCRCIVRVQEEYKEDAKQEHVEPSSKHRDGRVYNHHPHH